jgi:hypothetical protein
VKGVDLDHLYRIFGEDTVFLPIPKGTKAPRFKGWQNVTLEKSRSAAYQKRLTAEGNIGVLVGKPSSGLCSIDFDDERYFLDFLKLNPGLKKSTTTKGQRGCNLWVRITGDYPALAKITTAAKEAVGEWRADGGQTVVHGIHPEGNSYTISGQKDGCCRGRMQNHRRLHSIYPQQKFQNLLLIPTPLILLTPLHPYTLHLYITECVM